MCQLFSQLSAKSFLRCFILFYDNSRSCGLWPQQIMCSLWLLKIFSWPFETLNLISSWRVNYIYTKENKLWLTRLSLLKNIFNLLRYLNIYIFILKQYIVLTYTHTYNIYTLTFIHAKHIHVYKYILEDMRIYMMQHKLIMNLQSSFENTLVNPPSLITTMFLIIYA